MTNKVRPFYIKITEDMTPQMVQDAFDKCVDAGAIPKERVMGTKTKHSYSKAYSFNFKLFGVNVEKQTLLQDGNYPFGGPDKEITLDQLDEWLGLESKVEWKNGDECIKDGAKYIYVSKHPLRDSSSICVHLENGLTYSLFTSSLSKPETPEQKAERELYEAIEEAYDLAPDGLDIPINQYVAKLLCQQGYRKQ